MIVVGVDAHKRVHVALAVDDTGQEISQWGGPNHAAGWGSEPVGGGVTCAARLGHRRCLGVPVALMVFVVWPSTRSVV